MAKRLFPLPTTTMTTPPEDLKVTFIPNLYLQRRMWILNTMRREKVKSMLDVGCGEGSLLAPVCEPSPWLSPPKAEGAASPTVEEDPDEITNLHLERVVGLDISLDDLNFANMNVSPPTPGTQRSSRWEPLQTSIYHGGLEVFNEALVDFDCIVSSEVIEHLPEPILPAFGPMLLGRYHPRLLLITTPSYDFNARFTPPGVVERNGFPDPTQRTERVFRHNDHKFEWTREEFVSWCTQTAEEWGYTVTYESIGYAVEADPWNREDELGGASQVAEFRRKEGSEFAALRELKSLSLDVSVQGPEHVLVSTYTHNVDSCARQSLGPEAIIEVVKSKMVDFRDSSVRLEEMWFEQDVGRACGGWIELLIDAVQADPTLVLARVHPERRSTWRIELVGGDAGLWPAEGDLSTEFFPSEEIEGYSGYPTWSDSDVMETEDEDEEAGDWGEEIHPDWTAEQPNDWTKSEGDVPWVIEESESETEAV